MGLDVYLYKNADYSASMERVRQYEKRTDALWEELNPKTKEEKDDVHAKSKAIEVELGLAEYGDNPADISQQDIQVSTVDPEHYFKVGYFRSSYNAGGIENVVESAIGVRPLHAIFEPADEYHVRPDWKSSLTRAKDILAMFEDWVAENGKYSAVKIDFNMFRPKNEFPKSQKEAMDTALRVIKEHHNGGAFSNIDGNFWIPGKDIIEPDQKVSALSVVAAIPAIENGFGTEPCVYLITENEHGYKWYVNALKIVIETIQFVLAQPDREHFYFHWSG